MKNYNKINVEQQNRVELHEQLGLTGAEISINILPQGTNVPFVHSHKKNEEIYAIIEGEGSVVIDDEKICLKAGDWLRISPAAKRQFFAKVNTPLKYICIQVKEKSLQEYTMTDAIVY